MSEWMVLVVVAQVIGYGWCLWVTIKADNERGGW